MSGMMVPLLMSAVVFAFYMVLVAALLRKYKSTGDVGFVWLGVAVILWPFVSNLLGWGGHIVMTHFVSSHAAGKQPVDGNGVSNGSLVGAVFQMLQRVIGIGLLLVSIHFLAKGRETAEPDVSAAAGAD